MAKRRNTKDLIGKLYSEGYPTGVIARMLNVTERYVVRILGLK